MQQLESKLARYLPVSSRNQAHNQARATSTERERRKVKTERQPESAGLPRVLHALREGCSGLMISPSLAVISSPASVRPDFVLDFAECERRDAQLTFSGARVAKLLSSLSSWWRQSYAEPEAQNGFR